MKQEKKKDKKPKLLVIMTILLIILELVIDWIDDIPIYDGIGWHHIPESGAAFLLGACMKEYGIPRKGFILFIIILIPFTLFFIMLKGLYSIQAIVLGYAFILFIVLGYTIYHKGYLIPVRSSVP